jgi:hypothetical protein
MPSIRFSEDAISNGKIGTATVSGRKPMGPLPVAPDRRQSPGRAEVEVDVKGRRKYGNEPVTVEGVRLDSKREAKRWKELRAMLRGGALKWLARQAEFILPGGIVYRCDFIYLAAGDMEMTIEDAKGHITKEYALKKKLMAELGFEIKEV